MLRRAIRHGIPGIVGLLLLGAIAPADAAPKVRIVAYINVTSGCQEETVNRLRPSRRSTVRMSTWRSSILAARRVTHVGAPTASTARRF